MLKVVGASWYQTKVITIILGIMIALGVVVFIFGEHKTVIQDRIFSATVTWSEKTKFRISYWGEGNDLSAIPKGIARAHYKMDNTNTGWSFLEIETQPDSPDWMQAFAAGFVEGSLTWYQIYEHWYNTVQHTCKEREQFCNDVRNFLEENRQWIDDTSREQQDKDPFWHQVQLYIMQLKGLEHGFQTGVERSLEELEISSEDFLWMNVVSDLAELEQKFNGTSANQFFGYSTVNNFSTAFVKLLPEKKQLLVAHNTGGMYQSMQRILKGYKFHYHLTSALNSPEVPGKVISFSSYPGVLHSLDDFYSVSGAEGQSPRHHLAVIGTSINNFNPDLWNLITPTEKVLLGPRVMSANRLSTCGRTWGKILGRYNSGTGNKQWLVADYGRLGPLISKERKVRHRKKRLFQEVKSLLWVTEQYPDIIRSTDQSYNLHKYTYWASYGGLPLHKDISEAGNFKRMEDEFGPEYSYEKSSLASIFKRDHAAVTNVSTLLSLMRSNNFLSDPLSKKNPLLAIASRADLLDKDPKPMGIIDTKVLSGSFDSLQFYAVSGPPPVRSDDDGDYSDDNVENDVANYQQMPQPFQWSLSPFLNVFHSGQPDIWHFGEVEVKWFWSQSNENVYK